MRKWAVVSIALAALSISACIIGPKQDDPAEDRVLDTGTLADDVGFTTSDTVASDTGNATSISDTSVPDAPVAPAGDAKADGDAGCGDGSVAITASRYDEAKKCLAERVFFECQAGPDGGSALTCFVQISTSTLFVAGSTQIPSGMDFRMCTMEERMKTSGATACK